MKSLENQVKFYYKKNQSSHAWDHIERVLKTALEIASTEKNVDKNLLIAMIFFHDIVRHEDSREKDSVKDSLKLAKQIMNDLNFSEDFIKKVNHGIRSHSIHTHNREEPLSIEAQILFDADKIEGTGTIGIARWLMLSSNKNLSLKTAGKLYLNTVESLKKNKNSFFFTKRGREIGEERLSISVDFFKKLLDDLNC